MQLDMIQAQAPVCGPTVIVHISQHHPEVAGPGIPHPPPPPSSLTHPGPRHHLQTCPQICRGASGDQGGRGNIRTHLIARGVPAKSRLGGARLAWGATQSDGAFSASDTEAATDSTERLIVHYHPPSGMGNIRRCSNSECGHRIWSVSESNDAYACSKCEGGRMRIEPPAGAPRRRRNRWKMGEFW